MNLCVGRIPFLVCAPFFFDFLGKEPEFPAVSFIDGAPSMHCKLLKEGSVHLSPASSILFAQKPGAFVLSNSLCTSCSFEVRSVKFFSNIPIEDLTNQKIYLTAQSQTSIALLKILLEQRFKVHPIYETGAPRENAPCLLIGDNALEENEKKSYLYDYDLGTLWHAWQGVPFVFGAWTISKEALKNSLLPLTENYLQATIQSIEKFRENPSRALNIWLEKYPVNLPRAIIEDYFNALDYRFTDERKESLRCFYKYALQMQLIQSAPQLEFFG